MRPTALLFLSLIFVKSALCSSFYERPFPELLKGAPILARGKIGKSTVDWATLSDGSKHLFTYTDLQVSEVIKGDLHPGLIRVRELGGEKDGVGLQISGSADFTLGEDVAIFLSVKSDTDDSYPLQGMMMGKFNPEKGADGKEYLRGPAIGGSVQPSLRGEGHEQAGVKGPQTQWSLDAVRELVKEQEKQEQTLSQNGKRKSGDGLLSGQTQVKTSEYSTDQENLKENSSSPSSKTPRFLVILLGVAIGFFIYWKRKKRS